MSGITAQSATTTLGAVDTTPTNTVSGFVSKEQIALGLTGSPTSALWSVSKPSNSGAASVLIGETGISALFSPDVEGTYVISCLVDGVTTYTLVLPVVNTAFTSALSAIHFLPCSNAQIPTPRSGVTVFFSSDSGVMSQKTTSGTVTAL